MAYTNINNINNKIYEVENYIKSNEIDCMAITESFLDERQQLDIDGYVVYRKDRTFRGGGGVLNIIKNEIPSYEFSACTDDQGQWELIAVVVGEKSNLLIITCYITPGNPQEKYDELFQQLQELLDKAKKCLGEHEWIMMGDFNLPETRWREKLPENNDELLNFLTLNEHVQVVTEYTRFRANQKPSLLDLVIINEKQGYEDIKVSPPLGLSDHVVITYRINGSLVSITKEESKFYGNVDWDIISNIINHIDWEDEFDSLSVQEMWDCLKENIDNWVKIITKQAPTLKRRSFKMSSKMKRLINIKRKTWKAYKNNTTTEKYEVYKRASKILKEELTAEKKHKEEILIMDFKKKPKNLYKYIRAKNRRQTRIFLKDKEGKISSNNISKKFLENFTNKEKGSKFVENEEELRKILKDVNINSELSFKECLDRNYLATLLKEVQLSGHTHEMDISSYILVKCAESISIPLFIIMYKCLDYSEMPKQWKMANITPIFKKGSRFDAGNYRPVSILPKIAITFEKFIRPIIQREVDILDNEDTSVQFGFTKGRSCELNLLAANMHVTKIVDNGANCKIIYLDLSAAFDLVPHRKIVERMLQLGVNPKIVLFIITYLCGRWKRVIVNNESTDWVEAVLGVPQGSVLGPLLFKIYISELPCLLSSTVLMYADDIKLISEDDRSLQTDLNMVKKWAEENGMVINSAKTKVMMLGKTAAETELLYGEEKLDYTLEMKDLGVIMDNKLKYHGHVNEIVRKSNNAYYNFKKHIINWTNRITNTIIKTYIRPNIEYCSSVWNTGYQGDIDKIERTQRRITKLGMGLKKKSYQERLQILKLPTLRTRRERGDMINLYKIRNLQPLIYNKFFLEAKCNTRGNSKKIWNPRVQTEIGKRSFYYRTIKRWNELNEETVNAKTVNCFKNKFDKETNKW